MIHGPTAAVGDLIQMLLKATLKTPLSPKLEYGWETHRKCHVLLARRLGNCS